MVGKRFPRAKLIRYAQEECDILMSGYGKGVASEGFVGGFSEALNMITLLDVKCVPNDRWGIFEKAWQRIENEDRQP